MNKRGVIFMVKMVFIGTQSAVPHILLGNYAGQQGPLVSAVIKTHEKETQIFDEN